MVATSLPTYERFSPVHQLGNRFFVVTGFDKDGNPDAFVLSEMGLDHSSNFDLSAERIRYSHISLTHPIN